MRYSGATGRATTRPSWALGLCDRCGFSFKLNELTDQIFDGRPTGWLVCPKCNDKDHPQLQLGRQRVEDPQSLAEPRPDIGRAASTSVFGWMPVGNPLSNVQCTLGSVTVVVE